ncbi:MAG: FKBP-type peptidyl-prolyl cis-trans isomerase [Phaeodactylibacter sp.]|nr:FKBP-type peptidyl-prolyl cis-trans isomerase [Phaeodactylibacter sp.]
MRQLLWIIAPAVLLALGCNKDGVDQWAIDQDLIETYLEDNQINAERHSSGLYYLIEEPGSGTSPRSNSEVLAKYKGYLMDGSVFDQRTNTFFLSNTIAGWRIGIPLLKKGGKGKFFIPSGLGYGRQERPGIPANSVLIFEVELIDFQ